LNHPIAKEIPVILALGAGVAELAELVEEMGASNSIESSVGVVDESAGSDESAGIAAGGLEYSITSNVSGAGVLTCSAISSATDATAAPPTFANVDLRSGRRHSTTPAAIIPAV
tara:strand:- start:6643 stop:6984 length:342 start_codon:yes stop_codon:yes gene_type:complete